MTIRTKYIIFSIFIISLFSCKKGEFPDSSYDVPKIFLEGKLNSETINFIIRDDSNICTSYYVDTVYNGEYRTARYFIFDFKQFENENLKRTFKIQIKNCKDEVGYPDENMWCTVKNYDYKYGYSEPSHYNYVQPLRVLLTLEEYDNYGNITKKLYSDACQYNEYERFSLSNVKIHNFDGKNYLTGFAEFNCLMKDLNTNQIDSLNDFKGNITFGPLEN